MKLLFITHPHYLYPMEAHRVFRYLGDAMQQRGHTVHYFLEPQDALPHTHLSDLRHGLRIMPFIRDMCRRKQYDVLVTPGSLGWCLGLFKQWQLPRHTRLFAWHGGHEELAYEARLLHKPEASTTAWQRTLLYWANRQALQTQHGCLVTSTQECRQLQERYADYVHQIAYLPNGVSSRFYNPGRYQNSPASKGERVLMVGPWERWRYSTPALGIAMAQLVEKHPGLRLSIVNTQASAERVLADFPNNLHTAIAIQPNADESALVETYRHHDVFLLPSRHTSMPLALLEAMASALPVVATQVNGLQTVITHYENGLLIPPDDSNALVQSVSHLIENPPLRQQLGESAFETVSRYYTWRQIADIFEEKLRQAIQQATLSDECAPVELSGELPLESSSYPPD